MASRQDIIDHCMKVIIRGEDGKPRGVNILRPLSAIGVNFEKLSRNDVRALAVALTRVGIHPGMNSYVSEQHKMFWDATGKHLLDPPSLYFKENIEGYEQEEIWEIDPLRNLYTTVIMLHSGVWGIPAWHGGSTWHRARGVDPAEYLVYPLFEAVLKRELRDFITRSGKVLQTFDVKRPNGKPKTYKKNDQISNIGHLCQFYQKQPAFAEISSDLEEIFNYIRSLYPGQNAVDVIASKWRNPALHGDRQVGTARSVVLNLTILVSLSSIGDQLWIEAYDR